MGGDGESTALAMATVMAVATTAATAAAMVAATTSMAATTAAAVATAMGGCCGRAARTQRRAQGCKTQDPSRCTARWGRPV